VGAPSNPADGQKIELTVTQDATGSRTLTWNAAFAFGTAGAPALSTAPNAADIIGFKYYGGGIAKWRCLGSQPGF
jgi:hypothetical protein